MKEVYVLVEDYTNVDSGDFATNVLGVYQDLEQAKLRLAKEKRDIVKHFQHVDYEMEESETVFSIWETGEWATFHDTIMIVEKEIE